MADKLKFPLYLWKSNGEVTTCDGPKDIEVYKAQGYILASRPNVFYPKALYNAKGESIRAENKNHHAELAAQGWGEDYIAPVIKPQVPAVTDVAGGLNAELVQLFSRQIQDLTDALDALANRMDAMEGAFLEPAPAAPQEKPGKKSA